MEVIVAIVKHPGKAPEAQFVEDTPEALGQIVGGPIEQVQLTGDLTLLCNGGDFATEIRPNVRLPIGAVCGVVAVVRAGRPGEFKSLSPKDQAKAIEALRRHAI